MQDQIAELAARLAKATTEEESRSVDLAAYYLREALEQRHKLTVNLLLAQIAALKEMHDADVGRLRKLESEAQAKIDSFCKDEAA